MSAWLATHGLLSPRPSFFTPRHGAALAVGVEELPDRLGARAPFTARDSGATDVDDTTSTPLGLYYGNRTAEQRFPGGADRVPARRRLRGADLSRAGPSGRTRAATRLPQTRRSAAQGPRCGRLAGDQPEHGVEGLPRTGNQGSDCGAARPGHVHPGDAEPGCAPRADRASAFAAGLVGQGRRGRARRERDRGTRRQRAAGLLSAPRRFGHRQCCGRWRDRGGCMNVIEATSLGKRYGSTQALLDCTLAIPAGHVAALVGPNGAGKSTLLSLAVGLSTPSEGTLTVLGGHAPGSLAALDGIAFVAQDTPLYRNLSAGDMLHLTRNLNRHFDWSYAETRRGELGIPLKRKAGRLSGGQQAQLALTLALARHPTLLILDEPVAMLDPIARHDFMATVLTATVDDGVSVLLSSHVLAELERVADYLIVLSQGRVQMGREGADLL